MHRDDLEIAKRAIEKGFITQEQLHEVLAAKGSDAETTVGRKDPVPIPALLVQRGFLKADDLATLVSEIRGVPEPAQVTAATLPTAPVAAPVQDTPPPAPAPEPPPLPTGQQSFGKFMLVNRLGEGRSGVLYRSWQKNLRRWVTLRLPRATSGGERALFVEGAHRAAMLEHASILRTFEVGVHEQIPFAAMEYLKGRTFDQAVNLQQRRIVEIMLEAATALHFAQERNVFHGNLKPSNVMLAETGDSAMPERVVVLDFAIPAIGACGYTPPEFASAPGVGTPTARSDVYGLGATLYRALTNQAPYSGPAPLDIAAQILQKDPPAPKQLVATIPSDLDAIVRKALSRQPDARHAGAREFAQDLKAHLRKGSVASRKRMSKITQAPPRKPLNLNLVVIVLAALAVAAFAVVAVVMLRKKPSATDGAKGTDETAPDGIETARPIFEQGRQKFLEAERLLTLPTTTLDPHRAALRAALESFDKAVRAHPTYAEAHAFRGRVLHLMGKATDAEAAFKQAVEADARNPAGWLGRAELLLSRVDARVEMKRAAEVTKRRRDSSAAPPPDPYFDDNDLRRLRDRAVEDLRQAIECQPDPFEADKARAEISWLLWDTAALAAQLEALIQEHRTREELLARRGRLRRFIAMEALGTEVAENERASRYAKALETAAADFDQVVRLRPADPDAHVEAGDTWYEQFTPQGWEEAANRYQAALKLDQKHAPAHYQLAWCRMHQARPPEAKQSFARCSELLPDRREYLHLRAHAAWLAQDRNDLSHAAKLLTEKFDREPLSWVFAALARILEKDFDAAEAALRRARDAAPTEPSICHLLGLVSEARGRWNEAAEAYGAALRMSADLGQTRMMRAFALVEGRSLQDAAEELNRMRAPIAPEALAMLGAVLLLLDQPSAAASVLERATQAQHHPIYATGNLALAFWWMNQPERAREVFERAFREARNRPVGESPEKTGELWRFCFAIAANYSALLLELGEKKDALDRARDADRWNGENAWAKKALADALEASGDADGANRARQLARGTGPSRGLVMIASIRRFWYTLTFGRPGWEAQPETFTIEFDAVRETVPVPRRN